MVKKIQKKFRSIRNFIFVLDCLESFFFVVITALFENGQPLEELSTLIFAGLSIAYFILCILRHNHTPRDANDKPWKLTTAIFSVKVALNIVFFVLGPGAGQGIYVYFTASKIMSFFAWSYIIFSIVIRIIYGSIAGNYYKKFESIVALAPATAEQKLTDEEKAAIAESACGSEVEVKNDASVPAVIIPAECNSAYYTKLRPSERRFDPITGKPIDFENNIKTSFGKKMEGLFILDCIAFGMMTLVLILYGWNLTFTGLLIDVTGLTFFFVLAFFKKKITLPAPQEALAIIIVCNIAKYAAGISTFFVVFNFNCLFNHTAYRLFIFCPAIIFALIASVLRIKNLVLLIKENKEFNDYMERNKPNDSVEEVEESQEENSKETQQVETDSLKPENI